MFPTLIGKFAEFLVSIERIQSFLLCDEVTFNDTKYDKSDENSILIKDANFFWGFQQYKNDDNNGGESENKNFEENRNLNESQEKAKSQHDIKEISDEKLVEIININHSIDSFILKSSTFLIEIARNKIIIHQMHLNQIILK